MFRSKKLIIVCFAVLMTLAACGKKKDESGPARGAPVTNTLNQAVTTPAVIVENPDGTITMTLTVPDGHGVSTVHKGNVGLNQDGELKSADGQSVVKVRQIERFGILMAFQSQLDSSVGKFYVIYRSQDNGYVLLVNGISMLKNDGIDKAYYFIDEARGLCKYTEAQAFAAVANYFNQSPNSTFENYIEFKKSELSASGTAHVCKAADLASPITTPVPAPTPGTNPSPVPVVPPHPVIPAPDQANGSGQEQPSKPVIPPPPEDRPVVVQQPSPSQQSQQPPQAQYPTPTPVQDCPAPVVVAPPRYQQSPEPIYQQQPPVIQQPIVQQPVQQPSPVYQQPPSTAPISNPPVLRPITDAKGYHTDWQLCYASGKWKTDGNLYCKQTWWTNCSPESGGHKCKVSESEVEEHHGAINTLKSILHPESASTSARGTVRYGPWTREFATCYAAGAWQSNGNRDCRKESWAYCSPETNGEQCRPVLN